MEAVKRVNYFTSFMKRDLIHLNLQLLYNCNFKCVICDFWKPEYNDAPRLSVEQIRIINDKISQIGPMVISLGGGEPLIHKDILEIIRIFAKKHFPVMICNGWFITKEKARAMWEAGIYEVSISVDYADAAMHDKQRGKESAYERALQALKILNETRVHAHQRVHMITVVMDDNLSHIEPLIKIAKSLGVTYLVTFYSSGRGKKDVRTENTDVSEHLLELRNKYPTFVALPGYIGKFSQAIENHGILPCYAGKNLFNIDSQGDVSLCIDKLDDKVGNIITDDMQFLKSELLIRHQNNDCGGCWTSCRGSIETMMYGRERWYNLYKTYKITKKMPLVKAV